MVGGWLAKGMLVLVLLFAVAGIAHAQTKPADLPVRQQIDCAPVNSIPGDLQGSTLPIRISYAVPNLILDLQTTLFGVGIMSTENSGAEMEFLPWVAKVLLDMPCQPALLLADPIERLLGLFY
jgi:hypothetical protein